MMEYRLSDKLNSILSLSKEEAERLLQPEVSASHLLLGMIRDGSNKAVELLSGMGVDLSDLRMRLESAQVPADANADKVPIEKIALSVSVTRRLKISMLEARLQKKEEVDALRDSDSDGMPNWFEEEFGLNKSGATDAQAFTLDPEKRYTNLEMYLHYLVKDIVSGGNTNGTYTQL